MNRWSALAFLLALALALALRLPALDRRPLHNDEGINATKLAALLERGEYHYDPHEFHGPTLYYFSALITRLGGAINAAALSDSVLRITPVAFGVGLILLLLLLRDALGDVATVGAALLTAVSPAMVFYSRYFIHEMLLVFFTLLVTAAGWRYWQSRKVVWAILTGAGVGLMWATKETFVFAMVAMLAAMLVTSIQSKRRFSITLTALTSQPGRHLVSGSLAALLVGTILFTSFFTNWRGVLDSILTYEAWFNRAGGASAHIYPWHFYFERLLWFHPLRGPVWTEATIALLAIMGSISAFVGNRAVMPQPGFVRLVAFYTFVLAGLYAFTPYKTPWCLLGFWSGVMILGGVGLATFWRAATGVLGRILTVAAFSGVLAHLAWQAWRAGDEFAADRRNPYVYAQTLPDALRLVERVESLARIHPDGDDMPVKVIMPVSEWPLPWYLRELKRVGWWAQPPEDVLAPVIISDVSLGLALDEKTGHRWLMAGMFELRPGVFLELYVELGLWKQLIESPRASQ